MNIRWKWRARLFGPRPGSCDHYYCLFDADRRHRREVGDVERCQHHGHLIVVTQTRYSPDSNGGTTYTHMKRLHWWRLAYWRMRRRIPHN